MTRDFLGVYFILLRLTQVTSFVIQNNLHLEQHNFAFLTSFCGKPTGAVLEYNIEFLADNCCPSLLSYFENQWLEIWPDPHKNCTEKQRVLRKEWGQVLNLTMEYRLAGCQQVSAPGRNSTTTTNTTYFSCKGQRVYEVHSYNPSTPKCWFIAANSCNTKGLQLNYTFNITGAYYNSSERRFTRSLGNVLVFLCMLILPLLVF